MNIKDGVVPDARAATGDNPTIDVTHLGSIARETIIANEKKESSDTDRAFIRVTRDELVLLWLEVERRGWCMAGREGRLKSFEPLASEPCP